MGSECGVHRLGQRSCVSLLYVSLLAAALWRASLSLTVLDWCAAYNRAREEYPLLRRYPEGTKHLLGAAEYTLARLKREYAAAGHAAIELRLN